MPGSGGAIALKLIEQTIGNRNAIYFRMLEYESIQKPEPYGCGHKTQSKFFLSGR